MSGIMSQMAINFIITLIRSMMDNGLVAAVQEYVIEAFNMDVSGIEKKDAVMNKLDALKGVLGTAFAATAPWLINMLIEAIVGHYKIEND